ncbi:MAG: ATP-binding cassette domain-containing protein [Desulfobulbaceae bacterium]|nr:ATP-binding cassette domain-containing protein [Desulfobulbaceae bacterium]
MKLYKLKNIKRTHGARTVLHIDSLSVVPKKIYTLIGPNGAGKTSLLKILSFLDFPTSGSLTFMDRPVTFSEKHLYEFRKDVVLLDQTPIMFTGSVWKNIEFGLKVRKLPSAERKKRIEEALELVGMERFANYEAHGLSGGETKRVALARALVLRPTVLLCDEPTANVDSENQEIILDIIEQTNRRLETSIIFSTHYLSQGQRLADHTLLLQQGSLSDLVNDNIFKITVANRTENDFICQLTGQLYLRLPSAMIPQEVSRGKIHIDPDQIVCNPQGIISDGTQLRGHITELRQQSGTIRLQLDVGVNLGVHMQMEQYRAEKPGIGDKMSIYIPHQSINFSQTGRLQHS